jgi:hypothetical protein
MVLALTAPPARTLPTGAPVGSGVVITSADRERTGRSARFATPAAMVYSSVFSLVQLGLVAEAPGRSAIPWWAVVATACYLPFHLYHVYWPAQGARRRPVDGRWRRSSPPSSPSPAGVRACVIGVTGQDGNVQVDVRTWKTTGSDGEVLL